MFWVQQTLRTDFQAIYINRVCCENRHSLRLCKVLHQDKGILDIILLSNICVLQTLFPSLWFAYSFSKCIFCGADVLILMKSSLSNIYFMVISFWVLLKKSWPVFWSQRYSLKISSTNVTVLVFIFKSMIHFEFIICSMWYIHINHFE